MSITKEQLIQRLQADKSPGTAPMLMHDGQSTWEIDNLTHEGVGGEVGRKGGEATAQGGQTTPLFLRVKRYNEVGGQVGAGAAASGQQKTPAGR